MKKLFLFTGIVIILIAALTIAQEETIEEELETAEEELPNPGVTPDKALYGLDRAFERISLALTFNRARKARRRLQIAAERLAELRAMEQRGKPEFIDDLVEDHNNEVEEADNEVEKAKALGKNVTELSEHVATMTYKHVYVLERVLEKVPEQAKPAIRRAIAASTQRQNRILGRLKEVRPVRAARLHFRFAEGELLRLRKGIRWCKVSCERSCEAGDLECVRKCRKECVRRFAEKIKELLGNYKEHLDKSEEITDVAKGLGKNVTEVEQLVAEATSKHLAVLADVYEEVPEEAKEAIERAMNVSVRGRERVVRALKERRALGNISEELLTPEDVEEKIPLHILKKVGIKKSEAAGKP